MSKSRIDFEASSTGAFDRAQNLSRNNTNNVSASFEQKVSPVTGLPRFLRVEEVANLLRCKKRRIYDMVEQQRIPHRKVGGRLLFDADEIIEWTKLKD